MAHAADELEDRLIDFGTRIIRLTNTLPRTYAGRHIAQQLLRSGTAPAAHYGEARVAESRADFIHKLRIALKELSETQVWLKMVDRANMLSSRQLDAITDENRQLCRVIGASLATAKQRRVTPNNQ